MDFDFIPFSTSNNEDNGVEGLENGSNPPPAPALLTETSASWLNWSCDNDCRRSPPLVRLHNEILTFCEYIAPNRVELNHRDLVLQEITELIHSIWPNSSVHVFGSQMTKILTPSSDLDIAVLEVPLDADHDMTDALQLLAEKIKEKNMVTYVEAITNAKVPIVKMDHASTGISVDICINNDSGLKTGKTIGKMVRDYPPLRPLTIVLKTFLAQRRLNDTYSGGLGSFVLCSIIASFLQMKAKIAKLSRMTPSWNLGTLLLEFFQLYGSSFNYVTTGISISEGGEYFAKKKRKIGIEASNNNNSSNNTRQNLLCIENPDSPDLDMGRNSFMMPKVRRAFEHAHQLLCSALSDYTYINSESYLSFVIRPDDPYLLDRPGPELASNRTNVFFN